MKRFLLIIGVLLMAATNTAQGAAEKTQTAIFAGGCFWCMQAEFEQTPGVVKVLAGYTGGTVADPTYEQVSSGTTGHVEAVEVTFDPAKLPYPKLLDIFWGNVDPTDPDGQFCDKGSQYAAGIFYEDADQKAAAEKSVADVAAKLKVNVAAFVRPAMTFYPAEGYHQDYYKKNPVSYGLYKNGCGRAERLKQLWGSKK